MSAAPKDALKEAISRKFGVSILAFLGVLFAFGMLWILIVGAPDPAAEAARKEELRQLEQLRLQQTVPGGEAQRLLEQEERRARMAAEEDRLQALNEAAVVPTPVPQPARVSQEGVIDAELLRELDAMQRELGATPTFGTPQAVPLPGASTGTSGGGGGGIGVFEDGAGLTASLTGQDDGPVETVKPRVIPERSVHRGVTLRAALVSRIDTRNDGPLIATITRDVYDSRFVREVLIPRGSRLMGTYTTSVAPGVDRIAVNFDYLVLPNGTAIELPAMPAAATDGTMGVGGRYRSNLLRAIGPAFVVAAIGQWVDRQDQPSAVAVNPASPTIQSPSIMQQVTPQIAQAVQERYSAAKPYFVAEPGQEIRIVVTQEIEIPKS